MKYRIKVKTHKGDLYIHLDAADANDALEKFKLLSKEYSVDEIYPKETQKEELHSSDKMLDYNYRIGLDSEPYIPDSLRNKILILLVALYLSNKSLSPQIILESQEYLEKLEELEKAWRHIKHYVKSI